MAVDEVLHVRGETITEDNKRKQRTRWKMRKRVETKREENRRDWKRKVVKNDIKVGSREDLRILEEKKKEEEEG